MDNKNEIENEEINIKNYIKVIFSEKKLFGCIILIAIIGAVIFYWFSPRVYRINTWLEIGKIEENILIESFALINQKMQIGIYGEYPYDVLVLNSVQPEFIQIKIESDKPDEAKNDLEKIDSLILADHEEVIKAKKEIIETEIQRLQNKIVSLGKEKKMIEADIQTPISQFELFFLKDRLLNKEGEIENLYSDIKSLKNSLADIHDTKVVKAPSIPKKPISPNFLVDIILAGLIGLSLGVVFVFSKK